MASWCPACWPAAGASSRRASRSPSPAASRGSTPIPSRRVAAPPEGAGRIRDRGRGARLRRERQALERDARAGVHFLIRARSHVAAPPPAFGPQEQGAKPLAEPGPHARAPNAHPRVRVTHPQGLYAEPLLGARADARATLFFRLTRAAS